MIALAVATAFAAPAVMADATLYGVVNMWMTKTDINNADKVSVGSYASKLGLKGSNDLGDGLKAIYQMEFQVDTDGATTANAEDKISSDAKAIFAGRNAFAGLSGGFGTVMLGNMDSPMKSAMGKVAIMEDSAGDMSYGIANITGEQRISQSVTYVSPKFEGVQVAVQAGNMTGVQGSTATNDSTTSYSVSYTGFPGLVVALSGDNNIGTNKQVSGDQDLKRMALTAQYKMDNMVFGLIRENSETSAGVDSSVTLVNAAYTMDKTTFAMTYKTKANDDATVAANSGLTDGDKDITVAAVYGFNKSTSAWLGLKKMDYKASSVDDVNAVQVGFRTKF
jgi:predicted porin